MTQKELRELDAWVAENVIGWHLTDIDMTSEDYPRYTTDHAAAMEVLKKCAFGNRITCWYSDGTWNVDNLRGYASYEHEAQAETLELAICIFAKKLFSK
jgi:hypothetical protein